MQLALTTLIANQGNPRDDLINKNSITSFVLWSLYRYWSERSCLESLVAQAGKGFGAFFYFNQTHTAIRRNRQFCDSKVRDVSAKFIGGFHDHAACRDFTFLPSISISTMGALGTLSGIIFSDQDHVILTNTFFTNTSALSSAYARCDTQTLHGNFNEGTHWHRCSCIAQGANRTTLNTVRQPHLTYRDPLDDLTVFDAMYHAIQPTSALTAWCTLPQDSSK